VNKNCKADHKDNPALWERPHGETSEPGSTIWRLTWAVVGAVFFVLVYGFSW
jgi:hypothetical protein